MANPDFPSIPVPTEDPKALLETCLTMKRTLEMLTGQEGGNRIATHVFVQRETPTANHIGDLWFCNGKVFSFSVWSGTKWILVAVPPVPLDAEADFILHKFMNPRRPA